MKTLPVTDTLSSHSRLVDVIARCEPAVTSDSIQSVHDYLHSEEDEMALESLILFAREENATLPADVKCELLSLGRLLHLDTAAVFDRDFWSHAESFLAAA